MKKVSDLFDVKYGHSLELNRLKIVSADKGIAFVSRSTRNNGVVACVEQVPDVEPAPAGELTCALSGEGGRLSTFLQDRPFYTAYHVARLTPKEPLTKGQMLYYCMCIHANRYRYSFGRQANRTLRDILIPSIEEIPDYVATVPVDRFNGFERPLAEEGSPALNVENWKPFILSELFDLKKGKRLTKADMAPGPTPFIAATDSNNGLRQRVSAAALHPANVITVTYNGSVAEAFYQPDSFWASDDVNVLYPKFDLDAAASLFICTVIRREKFRYNYGRKWGLERMKATAIRLPATSAGSPDFDYMRRYVFGLPYSSQLN